MIGADPCTEWVKDAVRLDDRGFVLTGNDADASMYRTLFETSLPGVFAVGDVRSDGWTGLQSWRRSTAGKVLGHYRIANQLCASVENQRELCHHPPTPINRFCHESCRTLLPCSISSYSQVCA